MSFMFDPSAYALNCIAETSRKGFHESSSVNSSSKSLNNSEPQIISTQPFKASREMQKINVFIADFDDTIAPSTLLLRNNLGPNNPSERMPPSFHHDLAQIDQLCVELFEFFLAKDNTYVFILTNSRNNWVQLCSEQFLPLFYSLITKHQIPIISARSDHEQAFPNTPIYWKVLAMNRILNDHVFKGEYRSPPPPIPKTLTPSKALEKTAEYYPIPVNLINVGDSLSDRTALIATSNYLPSGSFAKNVKFIEQPNFVVLQNQLKKLHKMCYELFTSESDLDITMTKRHH
ncbi:hypothetical protein PCE1_004809 [Barthelona sp. PCE]